MDILLVDYKNTRPRRHLWSLLGFFLWFLMQISPSTIAMAQCMKDTNFSQIDQYFDSYGKHTSSNFDSAYHYLNLAEVALQNCDSLFIRVRSEKCFLIFRHKKIALLKQVLEENDNIIKEKGDAYWDQYYRPAAVNVGQYWGNYYYNIGDFNKCVEANQSFINSLEKYAKEEKTIRDTLLLAKFYRAIGNSYYKKGAYTNAKFYFDKAFGLSYAIKDSRPRQARIAFTMKLIGSVLRSQGDQKNAEKYLKQSLELHKKEYAQRTRNIYRDRLITSYYELAFLYKESKDYDKALALLEETIGLHEEGNDVIFADTYRHLGELHTLRKEYAQAEKYYQRALEITIQNYGQKNIRVAELNRLLGELFHQKKDYIKALDHFQKGKIAIQIQNTNIEQSTDISSTFAPKEWMSILSSQAETLLQAALSPTPNIKEIKHSRGVAKKALEALEFNRSRIASAEDKILFTENSYNIFNVLIAASSKLADITKQERFKKEAFFYSERSKASTLTENLLESKTKTTILDDNKEAIRQLTFLQEEQRRKYESEPDKLSRAAIKQLEEYVSIQSRLDSLINLNTEPPTVLNHGTINKNWASLLQKDETILHYFVGKEVLYIKVIHQKGEDWIEVPYENKLSEDIVFFRKSLTAYHLSLEQSESFYKKQNEEYTQVAHRLYKLLLEPVVKYSSKKYLIVPDGVLAYIPFETLLTAKPNSPDDFRTFPFAIKKWTFRYGYSLSGLELMSQQRTKISKALIFAPSFESVDGAELGALNFNQGEAEKTAALTNGTLYQSSEANKNSFIKNASEASILHIATHALTDERVPSNSFIAFGKDEDERLYLPEINAMDVAADLVVLSACGTGLGRLFKGEGLMSLSTGFARSGTKSLVSSLWSVNDGATAQIMEAFYEELSNDVAKNEALHQAKINYLNTANTYRSHPFFWSPLILNGNPETLLMPQRNLSYLGWIGLALLLILGFLFYRKKNLG